MSKCSRCQNDFVHRDEHKEQIIEYRELNKEHTKMRMQLRANSNPPPAHHSLNNVFFKIYDANTS